MEAEKIRDQHLKKSKEMIDAAIVKQTDLMATFPESEAAIDTSSRQLEFEKFVIDLIITRTTDYRNKLENLKMDEGHILQETDSYEEELNNYFKSCPL